MNGAIDIAQGARIPLSDTAQAHALLDAIVEIEARSDTAATEAAA